MQLIAIMQLVNLKIAAKYMISAQQLKVVRHNIRACLTTGWWKRSIVACRKGDKVISGVSGRRSGAGCPTSTHRYSCASGKVKDFDIIWCWSYVNIDVAT